MVAKGLILLGILYIIDLGWMIEAKSWIFWYLVYAETTEAMKCMVKVFPRSYPYERRYEENVPDNVYT